MHLHTSVSEVDFLSDSVPPPVVEDSPPHPPTITLDPKLKFPVLVQAYITQGDPQFTCPAFKSFLGAPSEASEESLPGSAHFPLSPTYMGSICYHYPLDL